jgi:hypothetical protein
MKKLTSISLLLLVALSITFASVGNVRASATADTSVKTTCANGNKYGSTYVAEIPGGQVRLGIGEVTRKITVGFFMGGKAFGFVGGGDNTVYGYHKLTASSNTFGGAKVSLKSMQIYVLNITDDVAIFQVDLGGRSITLEATIETLATEKVAGAPSGTLKFVKASTMFRDETGAACYQAYPGQPGVWNYEMAFCVNMTTEQHWWGCFNCCAFSNYSSQSTVCNPQV